LKILLVSATESEISHAIDFINTIDLESSNHEINFLITGVGMVNTAYQLTKKIIQDRPDFCIQAGIAGSFKTSLKVGEVINVREDIFSELGAEDDGVFISALDMKLTDEFVIVNNFSDSEFSDFFINFKEVRGITVNTVHGNEISISKIKERISPDVESMEGAAFLKVCKSEKIPCIQLRSISNMVEKRNKDKWNIPLAVKSLNRILIDFLNSVK